MEVPEKIHLIAGLFLVLLLVGSALQSTSFFADDLGFDFAGYAVRYLSAFEVWIKNAHFGVPVSLFDNWLPAILPLFFSAIGLGSFTAPVAISILIMRLLLIAGIVFLARQYDIKPHTAFLLGAIIAVNPITFKFLNRYYELFAWVAFIFAAAFIIRYFNNVQQKKSLALAVLFSIISLLSHFSPTFFLALFGVFIAKPNIADAKKLRVIGFFSLGISLFWLAPFFAYAGYSGISNFDSSTLQTLGMTAASMFLVLLLVAFSFLFFRARLNKKYPQEFQLLCLTAGLGIIKFALPSLALLNRPFIHSFNFFYIIVASIAAMVFIKEFSFKSVPKKAIAVFAIIVLIPAVFFLPKIIGNYAFIEPRFSTYELEGEKIDFSLIDAELQKIPKNERFEILPSDPIVNAYAMAKYDLSTAYGWGYNIVAINNSAQKAIETIASAKNCEKLNSSSRAFGISKWLALNHEALADLKKCGWQSSNPNPPSLFTSPEKILLVENGELLEYENKKIIVKASPPETLVKINYFPRWHAFSDGKEIEIFREQQNGFILIKTNAEKTIELKYDSTFFAPEGWVASLAFLALFAVFLRKN